MIRLGLTGSIGMGKSTTAGLFVEAGDALYDADAVVHDLYRGAAVAPVAAAFPGVVVDGVVDRGRLGVAVYDDPDALKRLEAIVHPLVRQAEQRAVADARAAGQSILVLDIPLLFETGRGDDFDAVVVASAPAAVQRERVLARPGMTEARLAAILAKQMLDADKRARADYVVDTSRGIDDARAQVAAIRTALLAA